MFLDYFNRPKWVRKYKIQQGTNEPINLNKLVEVIHGNYCLNFARLKKFKFLAFRQTVKVVLINQWLISNPAMVANYFLKKLTNTMPIIYELPTPQRFLWQFFVLVVIDEIAQYHLHK